MNFDALQLAPGWLSTALASAKDPDRPMLDKTVAIELFPNGVRLVATDSYILLHAWVPDAEHQYEPPPGDDEAPISTTVAMDPHGRARGFLAHLRRVASGEDVEEVIVRLSIGLLPDDVDTAGAMAMEGLEARWVILEHPSHEKLTLQVYEGEFPNWRKVLSGFEPVQTASLALNPEIVGRLSKLGKINGNAPLLWHFGGDSKMAMVEVATEPLAIAGAVMPVRWDFNRDTPADETPKDEA